MSDNFQYVDWAALPDAADEITRLREEVDRKNSRITVLELQVSLAGEMVADFDSKAKNLREEVERLRGEIFSLYNLANSAEQNSGIIESRDLIRSLVVNFPFIIEEKERRAALKGGTE